MGYLERAVRRIDEMPEFLMLVINIGIACFIILAHGGWLAATMMQKNWSMTDILPVALGSLPVALLIVISAAVALAREKYREKALAFHAIVLSLGAAGLLGWAIYMIIAGTPEGNFSWGGGMLPLFCTYPVYMLRRTVLKQRIYSSSFIKYMHVWVLAISIFADLGVLGRFMYDMPARMERFRQEAIQNASHGHAGACPSPANVPGRSK
ncbi:MAG: hypothetical protein HZC51_12555 [Nitrospirae bacterium]|nr:hypothetical protein [Nitrospirota bacterium]